MLNNSDIEQLVTLLIPFYYESNVMKDNGFNLCLDSCRNTFQRLIGSSGVIIGAFINGKLIGAIGGSVSPSWMDYSQTVAQEVFYYVKKNNRGSSAAFRLLDSFIRWAKTKNIIAVTMINLPNNERPKIDKLYKKFGFKESELFYVRRLK